DGLGERELQFLEPPGHPDRPALVPEMTLDLADDRGRGVGRELHPPLQVEPVDGFDQADRGDLGEIVQPFTPVAEPPGQVLHQRQVQLDKLAADPEPVGVAGRQCAELLEQVPGPAPVRHGVLELGRRRQADVGALRVEVVRDAEADFLRHLCDDRSGQPDLGLASHPAPADSRTFRSRTVTLSPGPTHASALPASADSTVQANVSRDGGRGGWHLADTAMLMRSGPSVKSHSRLAPGAAWPSSMPQASSTAMRRSSISSRVKSSRAARPAVAVRSTDRYAPSAGIWIVTRSWTSWRGGRSPPARTAVGRAEAPRPLVSPVTSALSTGADRARCEVMAAGSCLQPTAHDRCLGRIASPNAQ